MMDAIEREARKLRSAGRTGEKETQMICQNPTHETRFGTAPHHHPGSDPDIEYRRDEIDDRPGFRTCSDERHAHGCPCGAGGDVELRPGLRVNVASTGLTVFGGLSGEVVWTSHHSGTILVLLDGYGAPLPFGPSEIEVPS